MSLALLFSFFQFCVTMAFTPGPNNMMLAVSGVNFGFKRTFPHMAGIATGFPVMFLGVGLGLGKVFEWVPEIYDVLKIVGFIYLLYLAYKIAVMKPDLDQLDAENGASSRAKPLSFWQAATFQWVNPKAWTMVTISVTIYTSLQSQWPVEVQIMILALVTFVVSVPAVVIWTSLGTVVAPKLSKPHIRRIFNISMALLIVASVFIASFVSN